MTLREARKRKGYTQKDLAEMIGIAPTSLSFIENYKAFPRCETKRKLTEVLGDVNFLPAEVLIDMIGCFIGGDTKLGPQRADLLKTHIDRVIQCIHLDFKNHKPITS